MLSRRSKKCCMKWWPFYLLLSSIIIPPKGHLLISFPCLVNSNLLLVSNLNNAYHRLSIFGEGLNVALMPPPPPQLLIFNANTHLNLSVNYLYFNISTTPLIFDNNEECCCHQTQWCKTRRIFNQHPIVYTTRVIQPTTTHRVSSMTFVKLFYVNYTNQTILITAIQNTTKNGKSGWRQGYRGSTKRFSHYIWRRRRRCYIFKQGFWWDSYKFC